ncbi:hypothetical protein MJO28_011731, partial [Puccinia striiformis f. sp. tritici]
GGKHGQFPHGTYHNSRKITPEFFSEEAKEARVTKLINREMPFLYQLIKHILAKKDVSKGVSDAFGDSDSGSDVEPENLPKRKKKTRKPSAASVPPDHPEHDEPFDRTIQPHVIAATICSMVSFGRNRRNNARQIQNSVVLLACGVTERVNTYLNYIGLSLSRRTAHRALKALGIISEKVIIRRTAIGKHPFAPMICMDNLDFEEKVHEKSIEHTSQMFHGTWGYLHVADPNLVSQFDPEDFSLRSFKKSIEDCTTMPMKPSIFLPTQKSSYHWQAVIKSQITKVLLDHLVKPSDPFVNLPTDPPSIDPISAKKPDITMLKLMIASDNSAEGVGEVFEGIMRQTNLSPTEFCGRLQLFEGDLGTCINLESLRSHQKPSGHIANDLSSFFTLLGASHILWNVAQAIYLSHYGNPLDQKDQGVWHTLSSLGIPAERPTTKKDFTLMLTNLTKCHESTILYCLLTVMGYPKAFIPDEKVVMTSEKTKEVVNKCYQQFFSPEALELADQEPPLEEDDNDDNENDESDNSTTSANSAKSESGEHGLINLLLRLRDFASVVECDRAMRAGDIGRVLNICTRWSVMANGMTCLKNYAIHLPRMVLLLTRVLPEGLATTLKHSLLVSPSGRANHFVAKDFYLETQNFWLKYFYNHNGCGTQIDRLKDVFSLNVPILRELVKGLRGDSGKNDICQSHKHNLTTATLNNFLKMAHQYELLSPTNIQKKKTKDIYRRGCDALHDDYAKGGHKLNRMQPSTTLYYHTPNGPATEDELPAEEEVVVDG